MTFLKNKLRLIFVPAAAVKRRGRALSGIIGRKEFVSGFYRFKEKSFGLHWTILIIRFFLSFAEDNRILYIGVKSENI